MLTHILAQSKNDKFEQIIAKSKTDEAKDICCFKGIS